MPSIERWLLRDVTVAGRRLDCRIRDGRIAELAPGLSRAEGESTIDAGGGALLPGLADHHLHLRATAAAAASIDLRGGGLDRFDTRPAGEPGSAKGWLRVIGAGVELTRHDLDERWPDRPVRVQHRSGAMWTINSTALSLAAGDISELESKTGQFWRAGARLRTLLGQSTTVDLQPLSNQLAAWGITHITDATPDLEPAGLKVQQHLLSLAAQGGGARKIVIADHLAPDLELLTRTVAATHAVGRAVALHAVTAVALVVALAAIEAAGSHGHDRIEHAAMCDDESARRLADLDVTVVTQPAVFARHGEAFTADSDPDERDLLWRANGLMRAGVQVALSSDAPYGDPDPWACIRAAATRAGPEQMDPVAALHSMLSSPNDPGGPTRCLGAGEPADLCLLDDDIDTTLRHVVGGGSAGVRATFISGRMVYRSK